MNWYDPVAPSSGKFSAVRSAAGSTAGLAPIAAPFFGWLAWTLLVGLAAGVVPGRDHPAACGCWAGPPRCSASSGPCIAYIAHRDVVNVGGGIDHSLGVYVAPHRLPAVIAGARHRVGALRTPRWRATRAFVNRVLGWRPGLPLVVARRGARPARVRSADLVLARARSNANSRRDAHDVLRAPASARWPSQYLAWLGWVLFAAAPVLALAATYLRHRMLGWLAAAVSVAGHRASTLFTI